MNLDHASMMICSFNIKEDHAFPEVIITNNNLILATAYGCSCEDSYWVDYCYGENTENEIIYSEDLKPLICSIL